MKCCEKGRSMIEMLGVLAIVGVLSVGGIAGYSKAMTKYKRDKLTNQISELVINIRTLYFGQTSFEGITKKDLVAAGAVPNGMYKQSDINNSNIEILHAMNGSVLIFPSRNGDERIQAFELYLNGLDQKTCLDLVTSDWGQDPSSGFVSLYVSAEAVTAAKMETTTAASDSNPSAGIYTPGQHEMAVPLTVVHALSACACASNTCSVGLKYI